MNKLTKLLPALGLVFGATLAMAMNFADPTFVEKYRPVGGSSTEWYDLTNVSPGASTYQCNSSPNACTFSQPDISSTMVESGIFQKNGDLPILED